MQHLSYECELLDIDDFPVLAKLNLSTLEIRFHSVDVIPRSSTLPRANSLGKLSLELTVGEVDPGEEPVWVSNLANIVECCPNITSLRLFDSIFPQYEAFVTALVDLRTKITSLELNSAWLTDSFDISCDHLLPQFSQVTYLSLGDGTTSESLPLYLRQMTSLSTLRLGIDAHLPLQIDTLLPLFEGSTRHPSLTRLILDCFQVILGDRIEADVGELGSMIIHNLSRNGWGYPELYNLTEEGVKLLFIAFGTNGVQVEGVGATIVHDLLAYHREAANRAVLQAFETKHLETFQIFQQRNSLLSNININELDPLSVKLVKIDLPEENWFALSLE